MRTTLIALIGTFALVSAFGQPLPPAQPTPPAAPRVSKVASTGSSFIGVMLQEIDNDRAKALKLHEEAGVEITRVEPDSPAEKAGLTAGDAVMQYNGQRVEGLEQFSRLVRETPPGREVKLDIVRNGTPQTVTVKVGARRMQMSMLAPLAPMAPTPPAAPLADRFELRMPDMPRSFMSWRSTALGIECESLEGQLAQYFGVKEGVLVRSVSKGSSAEKAGIKAGDVITRVDDTRVVTPADVSSRIRTLRGKQVPMVLMRDHKEMTLSLTVDDEDRAGWGFAIPAPAPRPMQ